MVSHWNPSTPGHPLRHTNLIANGWKRLVDFYVTVFGCRPTGPERHNHGPMIAALTAIPGAAVRGQHVRLPGHGENGPTLEIFQYHRNDETGPARLNRPGFGHLAFEVPDVEKKRAEIHAWGGRDVGELVTIAIPNAGKLTLIYVTDPEGNILELQKWH